LGKDAVRCGAVLAAPSAPNDNRKRFLRAPRYTLMKGLFFLGQRGLRVRSGLPGGRSVVPRHTAFTTATDFLSGGYYWC